MLPVPSNQPPSAVQRGDRFLDVKETCKKIGVKSKNTLYAMELSRGFPKRIPVHAGRVVYLESEVEQFMADLVAKRDSQSEKDSK